MAPSLDVRLGRITLRPIPMQEKVHEHSGSRSQGASALEGMAPEEGGRPAEGRLEKAAHGAALMAQDQIEHLMTYRHYPEWVAEEVKSAEGHQQKTDRRDEHGSHLEMLRSHDAD